jgi:hypothetical protein
MDAGYFASAVNRNIMSLHPKPADKNAFIKKLRKILMIINAIQLV